MSKYVATVHIEVEAKDHPWAASSIHQILESAKLDGEILSWGYLSLTPIPTEKSDERPISKPEQ